MRNVLLTCPQHLECDADFLKAKTVERVKKHLNSMDSKLKQK